MKRMNHFLVLLMVYACVQAGGINMACADDAMDKESAIRQEQAELADRYFRVSGKQAEYTNLVESLNQPNVSGKRNAEVIVALDLIRLTGRKDEDITEKISSCYHSNSNSLVRLKCVEVLGELNEAVADAFAHEMLSDPDYSVESKLRISRVILNKNKLFGYPILFEGLVSSNKYERRIAEELMRKFEKYDGQIYDKKTEKKIDIRELVNVRNLVIGADI